MLVDAKCAMHFIISEGSFWAGLKVSSSQAPNVICQHLPAATCLLVDPISTLAYSGRGTYGCKVLATFVAPTINLRENKAKTWSCCAGIVNC